MERGEIHPGIQLRFTVEAGSHVSISAIYRCPSLSPQRRPDSDVAFPSPPTIDLFPCTAAAGSPPVERGGCSLGGLDGIAPEPTQVALMLSLAMASLSRRTSCLLYTSPSPRDS